MKTFLLARKEGHNMKKAHLNLIWQGMVEFQAEEVDKAEELEKESKAEAEKKAEIDAAWVWHDERLQAEIDFAWRQYECKKKKMAQEREEELNEWEYVHYYMRAEWRREHRQVLMKNRAAARRRAAFLAKQNSIKVATIACCAMGKYEMHDNHFNNSSYKTWSFSRSIRGNHGIVKSRTEKADRLIERAKKVTKGEFDDSKLYY